MTIAFENFGGDMRKGRRSKERLFYWPSRALLGLIFSAMAMPAAWAQGPVLTTISDTVYQADGTVAAGTALISWPAFQTAEGNAVAAGTKTATIGAVGAFSTQLVPNVGAAPTGTYYTVVFQLDDGTVRREYWSVPTTSPATIAAVRTTPGTGAANGLVSKQYVDAAVASRAADAVVVHLAGAEVIQGAKQFAAPPAVPTPTTANNAANKAYVDAAVANVGAGNFVAKAGGLDDGSADAGGRSDGNKPRREPTLRGHRANGQGEPGKRSGADQSTGIGRGGRDAVSEGELFVGSLWDERGRGFDPGDDGGGACTGGRTGDHVRIRFEYLQAEAGS
jgi:hypothetical protein